jgi:hypothetical protein
MGEIELIDQLLVRSSLFKRMEVDSVKILDYRLLQREAIVHIILNKHRN